MSWNTAKLAETLTERYPDATVIGCEFANNPDETNEWVWKLNVLLTGWPVCAGKANNTIDEHGLCTKKAEEILLSGDDACICIGPSIVVGNGGHIRRASMVWEFYRPDDNLCFRCTPAKGDNDPENVMVTQRRWQIWVFANLVGILFYKVLGVPHFAKKNLSQPTS